MKKKNNLLQCIIPKKRKENVYAMCGVGKNEGKREEKIEETRLLILHEMNSKLYNV